MSTLTACRSCVYICKWNLPGTRKRCSVVRGTVQFAFSVDGEGDCSTQTGGTLRLQHIYSGFHRNSLFLFVHPIFASTIGFPPHPTNSVIYRIEISTKWSLCLTSTNAYVILLYDSIMWTCDWRCTLCTFRSVLPRPFSQESLNELCV